MRAEVEIGIAEGLAVHADLHPEMIDAKSAEEDMTVVATQVAIERPYTLSADIEEDGVDELNDVVAPKRGQRACDIP